MSLSSQSTQQVFPFSADIVFAKLKEAIPVAGMEIKKTDDLLKRLSVSVGMSLFSWGENISIRVTPIDTASARVEIESALKLGGNLIGSHKHQKNFDKIIYALSDLLQK